jgi:gamma-glutamylaminecyclotransferase
MISTARQAFGTSDQVTGNRGQDCRQRVTAMTDWYLVFVYGTLKKGFPNHDHHMREARLVGTFRTQERYRLVLNGERCSPCLLAGSGSGRHVIGEVYAVDRARLARMDRLERTDRPDGYRRDRIRVDPLDGPPKNGQVVCVYLKDPQWAHDWQSGMLETYTPELARQYRRRTDHRISGETTHETGNDPPTWPG